MTDVPVVMLNNGQTIPQFGFGVFQVQPDEAAEAVSTALEAGYRHIDTAQIYRNEKEVGEAVAKSGLPRGEIFLTTKLDNANHRPTTPAGVRRKPRRAGLRLRRPVPDPLAAADQVRRRLRVDLADAGGVLPGRPGPVHRRIELPAAPHPAAARGVRGPARGQPDRGAPVPDPGRGPRVRCPAPDRDRGVVTAGPRRRPQRPGRRADRRADRQDPGPGGAALAHRSAATSCSPSRSPRPGSGRTSSIFDFELTADDHEVITALDRGMRTGPDPDTFAG